MNKLGEKIRMLREAKGLNQVQLASLLGVTNKSVSRYELSEAEPKLDTILKLSELFDVDANYLVGIKNLYRNKHIVVTKMDMAILDKYYALDDNRKAIVDFILEQNRLDRIKEKEKYLYVNDI